MEAKDLITDVGTGLLSHTKLWQNVAYFAATCAFIYMAYAGTATAEIWLVYLVVIGASTTASKFLSLRYGVKSEELKK